MYMPKCIVKCTAVYGKLYKAIYHRQTDDELGLFEHVTFRRSSSGEK